MFHVNSKQQLSKDKKRKVTTTLFHHHGHVLQVHEGDQSSLPLQWLALLGKVITGGLAPLLPKNVQVLLLLRRSTHTHPAHENKGWVCMCNTTWHDMNQGNPEVRPTTKVHEDRTKEEGNTAGTPNNCTAATSRAATQPSTHTHTEQKHRKTARHKNTSEQSQTDRPQGHSSQARTDRQTSPFRLRFKGKKENQIQQNHHGTVSLSWTCAGWQKGSKPCSIQVRLVTAIRLTSNWCTTVPYQKPKRRSEACRPDTFTALSVSYVLHGVIGQLEVRMFQHFTTFDTIPLNRIQEGRNQREEGEEAIELIQPASIWEVRECTSEMANRMAGPYGDYLNEFPG